MYSYPLGVRIVEENGREVLQVFFASKEPHCGIIFYDEKTKEEVGRYAFSAENQIGDVYCETITDIDARKVSYLFYEGDELVTDRRAIAFAGEDSFGTCKDAEDYKALVYEEKYDWQGDRLPKIPYEDCIVYCMHVRGFTKHGSSGVKAKGTFAGIVEKIPYLKELGVTTLELQPAYEFNELPRPEENRGRSYMKVTEPKLNYWGYTEGFYYAPKRSYASGDACREFKDMVKALHENGLEVVMQFYFTDSISDVEIAEILRFWHVVYHVDGFHLKGNNLPIEDCLKDPYLAACKLWYHDISQVEYYANRRKKTRNLALYEDFYLKIMRCFLKGDEGQLYDAMRLMQRNPSGYGVINYFTNYDGFTLADLVSYERKHNEANGEENCDGTDYNYSWNWGEEGESYSKQVLVMRKKQQKNAFVLLMLSQGTPLFFMGDEFGNSQEGNNNPYCQDNAVTWLDWKDLDKNKELYEYVKRLIRFRKEHSVFHRSLEYKQREYKATGCPELSYHGKEPWKQKWEHYSRQVGVMFCEYDSSADKNKYYYVAVNMHWAECDFGLPKLPEKEEWKLIFATDEEFRKQTIGMQKVGYRIPARSIVVFEGHD